MGLVDNSYQPWDGRRLGRAWRIAAIARVGLGLAFQGLFTKLLLALSYVIVIIWLGVLFLMANARVPEVIAVGNNLYREFLNSPQYGFLLALLAAMVGARLISRDLRFNAVSMYFSKSITRADYLAGKFLVIAGFLLSASFVPSLVLWVGQIAMGREIIGWGDRFRDLLAVTVHSLALVVPTSAAILAFSSWSRNAYVPGILWMLLYAGSLTLGEMLENMVGEEWCKLVSWANLTARVGIEVYPERPLPFPVRGLLDVGETMKYSWWVPASILAGVTVVSCGVVLWRLRTFEGQE